MDLSVSTRLTVIFLRQTAQKYSVGGLRFREFPISPSIEPFLALNQIQSLTIHVPFRATMTRAFLCSGISLSRFSVRTARLNIPNVTIIGADVALLTPRKGVYNMQSIFRHLRTTTLSLLDCHNVEDVPDALALSLLGGICAVVVSLPPRSDPAEGGGTLFTPRALKGIFSSEEPAWTFTIFAHAYSTENRITTLASVAQDCSRSGVLALPQFVHPAGAIVLQVKNDNEVVSLESKISSLPAAERAVVKVEVGVVPVGA